MRTRPSSRSSARAPGQDRARELQARLTNIRDAVRDWGYVDLIDGDDILTLVEKADPEGSTPSDMRTGGSDG